MVQIWGCERSGLFHAFSTHVLHRLNVTSKPRTSPTVRVTLLSRESSYRNILNEAELLAALQANPDYEVQRVRIKDRFSGGFHLLYRV